MPAPPARNREGACQLLPERIRPRPREELVARLQGGEGHRAVAPLAVDRGALLPLEGNVLLAGLVSRQGAELGQRIHPEGKGGLEVARATAQLPRVELGDSALELLESEVVWPRRVLDSGCSCTSSAVHRHVKQPITGPHVGGEDIVDRGGTAVGQLHLEAFKSRLLVFELHLEVFKLTRGWRHRPNRRGGHAAAAEAMSMVARA